MRNQEQIKCANCGHRKKNHRLHRNEGGHGGGSDGGCVTYSCSCQGFQDSDDDVVQEYSGDPMPRWVAEGAKVKVKRTPITKEYGLLCGNGRLSAGEIGTIEKVDGTGWWDWAVRFDRGRTLMLTTEKLEDLIKAR